MAFELLRMNGIRRGSPGAQAGFRVGDPITAADGQVFPSVAAFAAYAAPANGTAVLFGCLALSSAQQADGAEPKRGRRR